LICKRSIKGRNRKEEIAKKKLKKKGKALCYFFEAPEKKNQSNSEHNKTQNIKSSYVNFGAWIPGQAAFYSQTGVLDLLFLHTNPYCRARGQG
jgi:hypothetical protein